MAITPHSRPPSPHTSHSSTHSDVPTHSIVAPLLAQNTPAHNFYPPRARLRLLYDGSAPDSPASARVRGASLDDFRKIDDKLRRAAEAPKKAKGKGFGAPAAAAAPKAAAINTGEWVGRAPE